MQSKHRNVLSNILDIKDLSVEFDTPDGRKKALDEVTLHIAQGETLGVVGESGSGKTLTALSVMCLLPEKAVVTSGQIYFHYKGQGPDNLLKIKDMTQVRGSQIAMVFQEPQHALNPVLRCGQQVAEAMQLHQKAPFAKAKKQTLELFEHVRIRHAERVFQAYPHQLSGGQKQRVMIAMAISCRPSLLIADEPTTALDLSVQKDILELLRDIKAERSLSMLFISHDLGVIAEMCDRVAVMKKGKIVETGTVEQVLRQPEHPYTKGLVACRPSVHQKWRRLPTLADFDKAPHFKVTSVVLQEEKEAVEAFLQKAPLLQVRDLNVRFPARKDWLGRPTAWTNAVENVSFDIRPGEVFGLAGESGCGKTTLGKALARLVKCQSGEAFYEGTDLLALSDEAFRPYRRMVQIVFQDPYASLNPLMNIGEAITEPMKLHRLHGNDRARREKATELLQTVGLRPEHFNRRPTEFSGGQRQRICLARALSVEPRLLICDEIAASLDVSVQATVLNLLKELQEKLGLSFLFISHDLSTIRQMCNRLMVMDQGKAVGIGSTSELLNENSPNEVVRRLLAAMPQQPINPSIR